VRADLRVLQVLGNSAGGIARHVAQVAGDLEERGITIDVAGPPDLPVAMPKGVIPAAIPDGPRGHREIVARLRAIVREGRYDVVHAHGLRAGIDAGIAAGKLKVASVMTVHNLVRADVSGRLRAALYNWAEPLAVRATTKTFAVSEDIARSLRARLAVPAPRIEVLYLGIGAAPVPRRPSSSVRGELGVAPSGRLVVAAARLSAQKALDVMLDAVALLPGDVTLAVLGRGPDEMSLRTQAIALGLNHRVAWLGWRNDVADYLAAADVFCLSSRWEGIPLSAQEAILLGTPVVATAVGGMTELVTDRESGRLVPAGDPVALSHALREVLFSPSLSARYAAAAKRHVARRFSTDAMLARLAETYAELRR
jgi:glycosyltransferase involved in cell wall biosynthesis